MATDYTFKDIQIKLLSGDGTPKQRWIRLKRAKKLLIALHNLFSTWYNNGALTTNQWNKIPTKLQNLIPWDYQNPITLQQCQKAQRKVIKLIKAAGSYAWQQAELCDHLSVDPDEAIIKKLVMPSADPENDPDNCKSVRNCLLSNNLPIS